MILHTLHSWWCIAMHLDCIVFQKSRAETKHTVSICRNQRLVARVAPLRAADPRGGATTRALMAVSVVCLCRVCGRYGLWSVAVSVVSVVYAMWLWRASVLWLVCGISVVVYVSSLCGDLVLCLSISL